MAQDELDQVFADHHAGKPLPADVRCETAFDCTDFIYKGDDGWERLPSERQWSKIKELPLAPPARRIL